MTTVVDGTTRVFEMTPGGQLTEVARVARALPVEAAAVFAVTVEQLLGDGPRRAITARATEQKRPPRPPPTEPKPAPDGYVPPPEPRGIGPLPSGDTWSYAQIRTWLARYPDGLTRREAIELSGQPATSVDSKIGRGVKLGDFIREDGRVRIAHDNAQKGKRRGA